jgi:lipopolysaccharide heptosyltransferase II
MEPVIRSIAPEWQSARRILCVRLDTLGDVLMTTPAIRALKESLPESCVTLLTSPAGAEPAAYIPEVDDVLVYEAPWLKASPVRLDSQFDRAMQDRLRGHFDAAVIFTVYSQSPLPAALFCYLADIPLRLAHCRENPYQLLTHWLKETEPEKAIRHEVRRQLDLVATTGSIAQDERLSFRVPARAREYVTARLQAAGLDFSRPWIALHPGVTAPSRQYAPERYAQVARRLSLEDGLQIVFTGKPAEVELVERIRGWMEAPSISMAGQLSLVELAALLEQARLLLSNNTGPVHLAAAVATPVVVVYALTNPQHTPWGVPSRVLFHDVPCKYCYKSICPEGHHHCLELVPSDQVVQSVRDLLAEKVSG